MCWRQTTRRASNHKQAEKYCNDYHGDGALSWGWCRTQGPEAKVRRCPPPRSNCWRTLPRTSGPAAPPEGGPRRTQTVAILHLLETKGGTQFGQRNTTQKNAKQKQKQKTQNTNELTKKPVACQALQELLGCTLFCWKRLFSPPKRKNFTSVRKIFHSAKIRKLLGKSMK